MRIVEPQDVTPEILQSTNVDQIETDWSAGTYTLGERRVYERRVYEVVADPSTSDRPDEGAVADPPTWVEIGFSNPWRMFREGADSKSTAEGSIEVSMQFSGFMTTLAVLGIDARFIQVVVTDDEEGVVMDEERDLIDIGVNDWWEWYFLPYEPVGSAVFTIPPYPDPEITVVVSAVEAETPVAVGRLVAGIARDVGFTVYGTDIQLQDYSVKERNAFGDLVLRRRRTIKRINYDVRVPTPRVDFAVRALQRLSATPSLFIGDESKPSTIAFGVFTNVSQGISTPSISDLTLQVEEF